MSQVYLINKNTLNQFESISQNVEADRILVFVKKAQDLDLRLFMGKAFYYDFIQHFSNDYGIDNAIITTRTTSAANGNYVNADLVAAGTGINAKASFQVLNGSVSKVTITKPGTGWVIGDTFTCAALPGALFTVSELSTELVLSDAAPQNYKDLWNGVEYDDLNGNTIVYDGMVPALVYFTFARFIEVDSVRYTATGPITKKHDDGDPASVKMIAQLVSQNRSVANSYTNDIEEYLWNKKTDFPLWRYNERNKNSRQPGARIRGIDRTKYNRAGYGYNNNGYGIDGFGGPVY